MKQTNKQKELSGKLRWSPGNNLKREWKTPKVDLILAFLGLLMFSSYMNVSGQTIAWTNAAASTAWYTNTVWTPNTTAAAWTTANLAQFNNTGTATQAGINMTTQSLSIGAIEVTNARTRALTIGNSTATVGTLTLNGITVNAVANTILRNNCAFALTFAAAGGAGAVSLPLVAATSNINIDGTGAISVNYPFTGAGKNIARNGTGGGALIYTASNHSYTGTTAVNGGELRLNPPTGASSFASQVVLNTGGTLTSTGIATGAVWTSTSTLDLAANSSIALGSNAHSLKFANSSAVTWAGTTLTITGWTGTAGSSGTAGKIFFGAGTGTLTAGQLAKISFTGFPGTVATLLGTGELVPVLPSLTPSVASLTGFSYTVGSGPSASQSFTFTGANLTGAPGNITVDASGTTGYEVSTNNSTFSSSVTYPYASATLGAQTVYVRLKSGLGVGAYNSQSITITGGGASSGITASGDVVPPTPVLTASVPALTGFNYIFGFGPSASQSFNVTGSNLVPAPGNVVVDGGGTAYELSTDNTNFFSSVSLPYPGTGSLASTPVYIRLKASQAVGAYNGQTINVDAGATHTSLTASGDVSPQIPSITVGSITPTNNFATSVPTPSAVSTFTVNGVFLINDLTIDPVAGYEFSDNGGFSWSSSLTYNTASVNKTISVRLTGAAAGNFNGPITVTSVGATNSPSTIPVTGSVVIIPILTEVLVPQYFKGNSGSSRVPYVFKVTISSLTPNATYRFYNMAVTSADAANVDGAGVPIFTQDPVWVHSNSVSMSTPTGHGQFSSDGSGSYTGFFAISGTANARFTTGNNIFMRIMLNDGAGGTTVANRVTTTSSVKVLDLVASAGANNATAIRSVSNGQAKDFIFLYDNDLGTGRPISGTYFESDGVVNASAATFYSSNVDGVAKAWGTIIPNTLPNGIRYVTSYSNATGNQLCTFTDADGVWPTGNINTVNPAGGNTTPIVLANADVPMQCFLLPYANLTLSTTIPTEAAGTVVTITASITGTIATPQTVDVDVSGVGITLGDYTLSSATITIPAGTNPSAFVTFTTLNDILYEGIETVTIALLNPSAGIELGFNTSLDMTIIDDDAPKIIINEIMYNTVGSDEEWVELYNNDISNVVIDDTWSITGTPSSGGPWTRNFPALTSINMAPGQYITVKLGSAGAFPFSPTVVLSSAADQLTNTGGPLTLKDDAAVIDNVIYSPVTFTPAANGFGPSLSLNNPSFDNSLAASWGACKIDGTPNQVNFNCDASTYYTINSGNLNPDVFNATTAIWTDTPGGIIGLCPPFKSTTNYVIRNTHSLVLNYTTTQPNMNNLTINAGGKLYTNVSSSGSEKYIKIFGNISNSGVLGNGGTYDAIGLSFEGTSSTLSGTGSFDIGRVRKDFVTNATSNCIINANVNIRFPGGAFFNNIASSSLNLTINPTKTLSLTDPLGDFAVDGLSGTGAGDRGGNIVVNGTLNIPNKLYAVTNNAAASVFPCSITIGAFGKINTGSLDANITGNGGALAGFPITINTGGKLNVTKILKVFAGDLNSNDGLFLKSTATGTGLIDGSGAGNVIGNTTVERKIGPMSGYHYLSSPVSGAFVNNTTSGWRDDFTINAAIDNFVYVPGMSPVNNFPTVWEYDETVVNANASYGFVGATGTTDPITPLKGFACVVPGNTLVDVFGPVNNGNIPYSVTKTDDGFNLLGNPYPSPISWNALRLSNPNLSASYMAFVTTGAYAGNYGTYDAVAAVGTLGVGNIIASSQAFYATAVSSGAIQALNAHRTLDLNPSFYNSPSVPDLIRLEVSEGGFADQAVVYFDANETDNYNAARDALKMFAPAGNVASIYTMAGNKNLAINVMGSFNQDKLIPLGIMAAHNGNHTISVADLSTFDPTAMVYLIDNVTGSTINLRSQNSYTANLTAGNINNRFFIRFTPSITTTPVAATCAGSDGKLNLVYPSTSLVSVTVVKQDGTIAASLNNFNGIGTIQNLSPANYRLDVTYTDGYTASTFATVGAGASLDLLAAASHNSTFINEPVSFTATSPATNIQWNFGDGSPAVSGANVSHTFNAQGNYTVTATANDAQCTAVQQVNVHVAQATGIATNQADGYTWKFNNNQVTLQLNSDVTANGIIEIIDATGNVITSKATGKAKGSYTIDLSTAAEGLYFAKFNNGQNTVTKKFVINRN